MGYSLTNHELRVYFLCNPFTVGFVFLNITALFVITPIHKSHNLGAAFPPSSPPHRASNPAHKLFQPLQEFIAADVLLDSFRVALFFPYAFLFLHSLQLSPEEPFVQLPVEVGVVRQPLNLGSSGQPLSQELFVQARAEKSTL